MISETPLPEPVGAIDSMCRGIAEMEFAVNRLQRTGKDRSAQEQITFGREIFGVIARKIIPGRAAHHVSWHNAPWPNADLNRYRPKADSHPQSRKVPTANQLTPCPTATPTSGSAPPVAVLPTGIRWPICANEFRIQHRTALVFIFS